MVFQYFRSNRKDLVQNLKRCNNNVIHGKQAVDRKYMVHTFKSKHCNWPFDFFTLVDAIIT